MVHYIRFLRVPQIQQAENGLKSVSAVLTVTTDLGEIYFPGDLDLVVRLVNVQHPRVALSSWKMGWRKGARVVKLQVKQRGYPSTDLMRLHVSTRDTDKSTVTCKMPMVMDAWSSSFPLGDNCSAEDLVERMLRLTDETSINIWEETGESIARHIWDGAIGCLELYKLLLEPENTSALMPSLRHLLTGQRGETINVVELGSGCGVAGIGLAQMVPRCKVLLTDLGEAQEILTKNIKSATLPERSSLKQEVLDWDEPLAITELHKNVDLLIVCECIYNADSDPALISILQQFMKYSPEVITLVITKRRHYSETVFFDLMEEVGIQMLEQCCIPLPHHASDADSSTPEAEIYLYGSTGIM